MNLGRIVSEFMLRAKFDEFLMFSLFSELFSLASTTFASTANPFYQLIEFIV